MTIEIQLTPAVESGLAGLARMKGLPLNEYIEGLLESLAIPGGSSSWPDDAGAAG